MKTLDPNRRVVVTGLGVVSSIGIGWEEFWKNLLAGKSGISELEAINTENYEHHRAGEVKNFIAEDFMSVGKAKKLGRASAMAIAACKLALKDAKLAIKDFRQSNGGLCIGTTMGEAQLIESMVKTTVDFDPTQVLGLEALGYPANSINVNVAGELKISGPNILFANACAAGNYSIGYAFDLIKSGKTNMMLSGGSDALSRIAFTGFSRLFAMSTDICQPFDLNRKGMMLGEGSGILLLEEYQTAVNRNAPIYAEIMGYGLSCDAHHMANPVAASVAKAINKAIMVSQINPESVDYISAHGTGTIENDKAESEAVNTVFGKLEKKVPISSIKSMLGHTMGAASAIEAIACCLAIKFSEIPPTINVENKDPFCDVDCVPNKSRKNRVKVALNNSQAFGGNNACMTVRNL